MRRKKVLMIPFFYPPLGGAAIQRPYKFAQYLPRFGYEPIILTVKDFKNYVHDDSFTSNDEKIFRSKFFHISRGIGMLSKFQLGTIARFLSRHMFIPDDKIDWFLPTFIKASAIIRQGCDVLWTTSPPETSHLIGLALKSVYNIPWVADFRNEWSTNAAYYFPTEFSRHINFLLEDAVISKADKVSTLSHAHTKLLQERYHNSDKFFTIENGFDSVDLPKNASIVDDEKFNITCTGSFYAVHMPRSFIAALNGLVDSGKIGKGEIKIRFVGNIWEARGIIKTSKAVIEVIDYVPHRDVYKYLFQADILLITLAAAAAAGEDRLLPGKIYEYMAVGKPILAVVPPNGEVAKVINRTKTGFVASSDNIEKIQNTIMELYNKWKNKTLTIKPNTEEVKKYERVNLTKQLADIFDGVLACRKD